VADDLSLWLDEPYTPRPPLAGDARLDVCIVGGGIGGLSAAWHLAGLGIRATVVEGRAVASGASGRNGGFLMAGGAAFHNDARRQWGADAARRVYRLTLDAQSDIYAIADELGASDAFRRVGGLRLATTDDEADHVRDHAQALREDGFPGELLEGDDVPAPLRRRGRVALVTPHDAGLQPARWVRALARGAEARGVRILEGTPVTAPVAAEPTGGFRLRTPHGVVHAERVVVACDGALPSLVPAYAEAVRCRRLHMLATAPLPEGVGYHQPVYSRWGYEYHQRLPDGRLAIGGYSDLDGQASYTTAEQRSPAVEERLLRHLDEELGIVSPEITHRWIGLVGYTADQRPYAGAVPGVEGLYVLGGYSGTGNVVGFVSGRIVAEAVARGSSPDADLFDAARPPLAPG
jgi:glycine/D-amino acid oxidase-like deaminating enzyme